MQRRAEELRELHELALLMEGAQQLIRSQPEIAVAAAERLGWTVIPPSEEQHGEQ